jgi:signal transduction histidine kinase
VAADQPEHVSRPREAQPLRGRALAVEGAVAAAFGVATAMLAALGHGHGRWDVGIVLIVALALTVRAQFDVGAGYTPPTQLVFVSALLLEPPSLAPLIAVAGWALGRVPDLVRGDLHVSRWLLKVPSNCWFAIGPALVLELADARRPSWHHWPLYLAALAAQFLGDLLSAGLREWLELGIAPAIQLRSLIYVWFFDAALSPIGLLAAFASADHRFAFLAVLPLVGLLALFSTERTRRLGAELETVRTREAMIAGASHELRTPLTVMSGLIDALERSPDLDADRRLAVMESMRRQTGQLRHLVGQFIDYAELKAHRPLDLRPRPLDLGPLLAGVAELWEAEVRVAPTAHRALADRGALHGVLMSLVHNALKHGPHGGPVELSARLAGERVEILVADHGPGIPGERLESVFDELSGTEEGSGLGLFLAREAMRAQAGDVRLANRDGGGLTAVVVLPAA